MFSNCTPAGLCSLYEVDDVLVPLPHQLYIDPRLLQHLAHGGVIRELVFLHMSRVYTYLSATIHRSAQ